jgi:hypothetical protein
VTSLPAGLTEFMFRERGYTFSLYQHIVILYTGQKRMQIRILA